MEKLRTIALYAVGPFCLAILICMGIAKLAMWANS